MTYPFIGQVRIFEKKRQPKGVWVREMSFMDSASWRSVLEGIGPDDQPKIVIRTADGLEVAVEQWASLEEEVALIKGRIAGSPDGRRLFIIPYDKLSTLYVNRPVQVDETAKFKPKRNRAEDAPLSTPCPKENHQEKGVEALAPA